MKTIRSWLTNPPDNTFFSNELNTDPINYLATFLTNTDKKHLASSTQLSFSLFSSYIQTANKMAFKLACHVAKGEQDEAEALIKEDASLLFEKVNITDAYGRHFQNITVFQYALWAYDAHMWTMILKYLAPEVALEQLNELENNGTLHGAHTMAIQELVYALKIYVDYYNRLDWANHIPQYKYDKLHALWHEVGRVQCMQPVHVINEYCHPTRSFKVNHAPPSFSLDEKLPRSTLINPYNDVYKNFYPLNNKELNFPSALMRQNGTSAWKLSRSQIEPDIDYAAISHLWEVRKIQLLQLKQNLELAVNARKASRCVLF